MTRVALPVALVLANMMAPQLAEVDTLITWASNDFVISPTEELATEEVVVEHNVSTLLVVETSPP